MNRTYVIVPLVSMLAFAVYFFFFNDRSASAPPAAAQPADQYAARDGRKEAEADLAAGKLALIETSVDLAWDKERREIALSKYGVELRPLRSEAATEGFARYVDGYNRVMRPKVIARHGAGFFDTLHREAIALMESRRSAKSDSRPP